MMEEGRDQSCEILAASPSSRYQFSLAAYPRPLDGGIFSRGDGNGGSASKGRTIRDLRISCACQRGIVFFRRCG